ncbi:MAG: tyrosine-type recombinase/integrase [Clostridia bacterium]|nr:tyrosine-type recombinase/integrase [Clostridia bacterium]
MATIEKRGDGYRITVSCGYNIEGKQIRHSMTWKPAPEMTKRQTEKELQRQATLFEEKVKNGLYIGSDVRFADFADQWMDRYAKVQLRPNTIAQYTALLPRIKQAIGHIRLDRIQPQHLLSFYENLSEIGIRNDSRYRCRQDFKALLKARSFTQKGFAEAAGVSIATVEALCYGRNVTTQSAEKISAALQMTASELFEKQAHNGDTLSGTTILRCHALISSILSTAVHWQIIPSNPCERIKRPKADKKPPRYLDEAEARKLLECLEAEPNPQYRIAVQVLLFTGLRRGELLGLEWKDVDFSNKVLLVRRTSQYLPGKGIFEDETKNGTSERAIKCSDDVMTALRALRAYRTEQQLKAGDQWHRSDRLFTSWDGKPMVPKTLSKWFATFIQKNNLPDITLHSLRHTNATLQIAGGVPVTTVSHRLGHATPATTTRIYAHAIKSADEAAAETLQALLSPNQKTG